MGNEICLRSVLDCLDVAVVLTDDVLTDDGCDRIRFANRAFLRLVGHADDGLGDGVALQDLVDPRDRERAAPQRARLADGDIDGYTIRKRYLRPDGSRVWADVTLRTLPATDGAAACVVRTIAAVAPNDAPRPDRGPSALADMAGALDGDVAPLVAIRDSEDVPPSIRAAIQLIIDSTGSGRLGLTEVARRAGTSVRSLQRHFARHGLSAARVLKMLRLRRARALLGGSDGAVSVTGIAFACGFTNLGHFARDYRTAFGELPSATLGRARIDEAGSAANP